MKKIIIINFFLFLFWGIQLIYPTNKMNAFTVVIDPGHGGVDPGAVRNGLYEKKLNLELSNRIREKLSPFVDNIYFTRSGDTFLSLEQRALYANQKNADLFLSIHHDSSVYSSSKGISTHYSSYRPGVETEDAYVIYNGKKYPFVKEKKENGDTYIYFNQNGSIKKSSINNLTVYDPTPINEAALSGQLSYHLANSLASLGFNRAYTSSGSKDHNLYVTRWTNMTSVLIEGGFISNPTEALIVSDPKMQDKIASNIAETIVNFFNLNKSIKISNVSTDKTSPQKVNSTIKIAASTQNGDEAYFKFWLYDGEKWTILRNYSSDNTYNWIPEDSGRYRIVVHAKSKDSQKQYDDYYTINYVISEPTVKINTDKQSPQVEGTQIRVSADVKEKENKLFRFWAFDGREWELIKGYSTSSIADWTPKVSGEYKIVVHVKEQGSSSSYDDYETLSYYINVKPLSVELDKQSPQYIDSETTFIANAGEGKLYRFWQFDGESWKLLKDYSTNGVYTWQPMKIGKFKIVVHVKSPDSTRSYDQYEVVNYEIQERPIELTVDKQSPQYVNSTIQINANAGEEKLYRFWQFDGESWKLLKDYSTNGVYTWQPMKVGKFKIVVHVKSPDSTRSYDQYEVVHYEIQERPIELTVDKQSPQYVNSTIQINANAGEGKLYRFWQFDGESWKLLKDYSTNGVYKWQPNKAGDYKIVVHVKNPTSLNSYDGFEQLNYVIN